METIKNYLENMFMNLPVTPDVLRAKQELAQMMEDKYNELKAEGKTENEAVGIVISEFGNLSDLAEELGIHETVEAQAREMGDVADETLHIDLNTAMQYLRAQAQKANFIAAGVMCFILAPVGVVLSATNEEDPSFTMSLVAGMAALFVLAAIGVGLIVYGNVRNSVYNEMEKKALSMDFATVHAVREAQNGFRASFTLFLTLGIILCVLSPIAVITGGLFSEYIDQDAPGIIGTAVLLVIVAVGVLFILMGALRESSYRKLLAAQGHPGGINAVNEEEQKEKHLTPTGQRVMRVFWPTVTCIYLAYSFLTWRWGISWIIWPIAGAVSAILRAVFYREEAV